MALFTAILSCRDCGLELNRAEHVPEEERSGVAVSSGLAAGPCPNGCRSTFSDLNLNTLLTWHAEIVVDASALHCAVTGNPCGTDTWQVGRPCQCAPCQLYLAARGVPEYVDPGEDVT